MGLDEHKPSYTETVFIFFVTAIVLVIEKHSDILQ